MSIPKPGSPVRGSRSGRPIMAALDLLGRRWALRILWELRKERLGFRALQRRCGGLSPTIMSRRTAELRESAILDVDADGRYGLTALGSQLLEVLARLDGWAAKWDATLKRRLPDVPDCISHAKSATVREQR